MKRNRLTAAALFTLALLAATAVPSTVSAQSQLATSEARTFIGSWVLSFSSDMGPFSMNVEIRDMGGKVAATLNQADMGMQQEVTDIAKSGESLVLSFDGDFQGQAFSAAISIEPPTGNESAAYFDINQGQFGMAGTATKSGS
ncbi:MAG: hypothetical protein AB7T31_07900 [Gemmatimonadales bacterium]